MNSSKVFFYTFRTNKFIREIEVALGQKVYVIDKPAQDFAKLLDAIGRSGADGVCGIGMVRQYTRFEQETLNRVGNNKIDKSSPDKLTLDTPVGLSIEADKRMTFGPCNYVAFRLKSKLIDRKHYFIHLVAKDIDKLQAVAL